MIQASTLQYLTELKENNNKPWFDANRNRLDDARADFEQMVTGILKQLAEADPDMALLEPKKCIFRQYRDVRFSKDKTPYKHYMGASFDKGGKSSGFAGFYFHCEPGNRSMIGGGLWMPPADVLKKVRQEIDYCFEEFKGIISNKDFKKLYGDLEKGEYSLSREPKGYEKDNPAIEYLKLKSFVATKTPSDKELMSKGITDKVVKEFIVLMPLIKFINRSF